MNSVFYRNAVIVLFLTMMTAVAEFGGVHEAIFPEAEGIQIEITI